MEKCVCLVSITFLIFMFNSYIKYYASDFKPNGSTVNVNKVIHMSVEEIRVNNGRVLIQHSQK